MAVRPMETHRGGEPRPASVRAAAWLPSAKEVTVVTVALICAAVLLQAGSILWSSPGGRFLGHELGSDFASFYSAGRILNEYSASRLYDTGLQQRFRSQEVPAADTTKMLPYLYPPFVAALFRPLASMPYRLAFGAWLIISAGLYALGLHFLRVTTAVSSTTALLVAVSFSPFLFEAWGGGQLSTVAFAALAAAILHERAGRFFAAGLCAGFCCYKPTLLVVLICLFAIARLWKVLAGIAVTGACAIAAGIFAVGLQPFAAYAGAIGRYGRMVAQSPATLPQYKFVDLRTFAALLPGMPPAAAVVLLIAIGTAVIIPVARVWMRYRDLNRGDRALCWAGALPVTLLVSVYTPIYDVTLVVLSGFLIASVVYRSGTPEARVRFELLVLAVYAAAMLGQPVARFLHVQIVTLALAALAAFAFALIEGKGRARAGKARARETTS